MSDTKSKVIEIPDQKITPQSVDSNEMLMFEVEYSEEQSVWELPNSVLLKPTPKAE